MPQSLAQIGAAVPVGRFVGPGPEARLVEERRFPAAQQAAMAERPDQVVRVIGLMDRVDGLEIGADRAQVLAGDMAKIRIGKGRVESAAVGRDALRYYRVEIVLRTGGDADMAVGREIGRAT